VRPSDCIGTGNILGRPSGGFAFGLRPESNREQGANAHDRRPERRKNRFVYEKRLVACCATCYIHSVIIAFRHKGLKRLYEQGDRSKLPADMIDKIETILAALDAAAVPEHLDRPSFRLHPLAGDRKGQWAITVRANWRIVFAFDGSNVIDVDFVDYH